MAQIALRMLSAKKVTLKAGASAIFWDPLIPETYLSLAS